MPYLVADRLGPVGADGTPEPAPYTTNRMEQGKLVHYIDFGQVRRDVIGLGAFAAEGFRLAVDGKPLQARVVDVRVRPVGKEPKFATLDEARAAFDVKAAYPNA